MRAHFRSRENAILAVRNWSARRTAPALLTFLLLPAVGLFCWHWSVSNNQVDKRPGAEENAALLGAKPNMRAPGYLLEALPPITNPRYGEEASWSPEDPFRSVGGQLMVSANEDPFLWALANGEAEGRLIVKSRNGGISTLGPALPQSRASQLSDKEILQALQNSTGDSFRSFFSKLFGTNERETALTAEAGEAQEENPFSKIKESLNEGRNSEGSEPPSESKADSRTSVGQPPSTNTGVTPPNPGTVSTANTPRPHLMMFVGEEGVLHSFAASLVRDGFLESTELGLSEYNLLPFPDAPEFPLSLSVADFNGDGFPDVAFHISQEGLLRFYYGDESGGFEEGLRIEMGKGPRSLAAGDFDGDGKMDIAVSHLGTGVAIILFNDSKCLYRYKSYWFDSYRDYILATDSTQSGHTDLVGMTFNSQGTVLVDFSKPEGTASLRNFDFTPALSSELTTTQGRAVRVQAVLLSSSLAVNMDNRSGQLTSVLNVAPKSNVWIVLGDLDRSGKLTLNIATHRH